ncbi:MAG: NAD(+)/NADH kinase, partial [Verrucomicrobiota bacterium]
MKRIQSITFAVNDSKPGAEGAARYLAGIAECEGVQTKITNQYPLPTDSLRGQDLCCAIGGDGTLLGIVNAALHSKAAVIGINMGKLGFLATFSQKEAGNDLAELINGNYTTDERSVLECTTDGG